MVLIPRDKHDEVDCLKAKEAELQKLIDFDVYTGVNDEGFFLHSDKKFTILVTFYFTF